MRFGLGVTLMTDSYFANDIGGGWYGVPSFYTEYEAKLGQALADPVRVFASGKEEVWTRRFEGGFAVVSSLSTSNFTLKAPQLPPGLRPLPLSANPQRLSDQREAPAWQLVIDNTLPPAIPPKPPAALMRPLAAACVCSAAAPACCKHAPGHPQDWWASAARRAGFRISAGNWTTVTDATQSHQVGTSFAVSFVDPGQSPQAAPPLFEAAFHFVSPSTDRYNFAMTSVDAHSFPLSDGTKICVRELADSEDVRTMRGPCTAACIASGTVDQHGNIRDGRWQRALSAVPLVSNKTYEFAVEWDHLRGGYAAVDALLVESEELYNGAKGTMTELVVGAMDTRILLK